MKKFSRIIALVLVLLMTVALCSCGAKVDDKANDNTDTTPENTDNQTDNTADGSGDTYVMKIACHAPLTGASADWGKASSEAATYFAEYINAQGGFDFNGGKCTIQVDIVDSTSDSAQAPTILEGMLSSDDYSGIVGNCISSLAIADAPVAEQYEVPIFYNGTTDSLIGSGYEYVFRITAGGPEFNAAQVGVIQALNETYGLNYSKAAILYENTALGLSQSSGAASNLEAAGMEVVVSESYEQNMTDATALVTKIKDAGADILFLIGSPNDVKLILNTNDVMDYDPLVMGGGAAFLFRSLVDELGDAANGILSSAGTNWSNKSINSSETLSAIMKGYEEKYGTFMNDHGIQTVGQIGLCIEAAQKTNSLSGSDIGPYLHSNTMSSEYVHVMADGGDIVFDEDGNVDRSAIIIQWQDGRPQCVYPEDAASAELILP